MEEGSDLSADPDQLVTVIDEMDGKIASLQAQVAEEEAKSEKHKVGTSTHSDTSTQHLHAFSTAGEHPPQAQLPSSDHGGVEDPCSEEGAGGAGREGVSEGYCNTEHVTLPCTGKEEGRRKGTERETKEGSEVTNQYAHYGHYPNL